MSELEDRRTFLKVVGGAAGVVGAGIIGVPVASALLSPLTLDPVQGSVGFIPTVSEDAVPKDGTPVIVAIVAPRPRDAWAVMPPTEIGTIFLRRDGAEIVAMSTICPHLGCKVDADTPRACLRCPCHDSDFAYDGKVLTGPSPRGLDRLQTRVARGIVEVEYLRFKTGTPDKVPA